MHETELAAAGGILGNLGITTPGFFMTTAEDDQIEKLRGEGLIVQLVDESLQREPLRPARRAPVPFAPAAPMAESAVPAYYILELDGPLFAEWRDDLRQDGITLIESISPARYTARLTSDQVARAQQRTFVRSVALYGAEETYAPPATRRRRSLPFGTPTDERVLEIRIRRREDKPKILDWLKTQQIPIDLDAGRMLRIRISPAVDVAALEKLDGVRSVIPYVPRYDVLLHQPEGRVTVEDWLKQKGIEIEGSAAKKFRVIIRDESVIDELAAVPEVAQVEEYVAPDPLNDVARTLLGIDRGNPTASLSLTGRDQIVGIADTGLDDKHADFTGRIAGTVARGRANNATDPDGHGTHVAGSVAGTGKASNGKVRGIAPEAKIFFQSILDSDGNLGGLPLDLHDLFDEAYKKGARIHNNSWGAAMGGRYTVNALEVDDFVEKHRDMLIVIAAGNEGQAAARRHSQPGFVDWLSIGSPASCKNALTVGASRSNRSSGGYAKLTYGDVWPTDFPQTPIHAEKVSGNADCLAAFSSRGPCDDYRIKPDVVAPGTDILSTKSSLAPADHFWGIDAQRPQYGYMGGTSMAAPIAAGCAALVREYYQRTRNHSPSAALVKATLINGTKRLAGQDATADHADLPNYHQGFGVLDMTRTVPDPQLPPFKLEFLDENAVRLRTTGDRHRRRFTADAGSLRITLAWTDPEGRSVQNSLALLLEHRGSRQKWIGNQKVPLGIVTPDPTNNVVVIRVENAAAGEYMVQVTAYNLAKPPQDFALVVTGNLQSALLPI